MFLLGFRKFGLSVVVGMMALLLFWVGNVPAENSLPYAKIKDGVDLLADAQEAGKKQIPILLFFSMKHCPFCIEVEEDYLKPILRNSEYDNKVIIRKIRIDGTGSLKDFSGKEYDAEEFGDNYNVSMVPTLILVDTQGNKTVPPIIGIRNSHYYSHDLDKAINASTLRMRAISKR